MFIVIDWHRPTETGRVNMLTDDETYAKEIAEIVHEEKKKNHNES